LLYKKIGVVLFALQVTDKSDKPKTRMFLNPADFAIPDPSQFSVLAFVIAENKASSDLTFSDASQDEGDASGEGGGKRGFTSFARVFQHMAAGQIGDRSTSERWVAMKKQFQAGFVSPKTSSYEPGGRGSPPPGAGAGADDSFADIQAPTPLDSPILRNIQRPYLLHSAETKHELLVRMKDKHFRESYYLRERPVSLADVTIKGSVRDVLPNIRNHILIIGKGMGNLFDLIRPLRAKYAGRLRPIILVSPDAISHDIWNRISLFDAIMVIRGSPLEERNLRRAEVFKAQRVVVLADGSADAAGGKSGSMAALVDSDVIFTYQRVRKLNPTAQIVVEIINTSNIGYLYNSHAKSATASADTAAAAANYKFSTQFAAGELFTTSLLDSIVCQVNIVVFIPLFYIPVVVTFCVLIYSLFCR
jgi:hypothetical protein